ncbi:DBIRD complex subunit ZNF326-like isoform X2 [Venturia canescens]|uniref:DBIRD complex subunit ZNF326-like isoform X2 n=1 Tax=Venturia canescens TaxID=32260 RepID=UPI001C9C27E0|nr:DBIRD complex subunit ZNF326-like isoform X2 [Venturia canescens]
MSSRGRGFSSRGNSSYRGNRGGGGGSGDWGSGGNSGGSMNRGGYSSSRGSRFKYSTTSYDSRNKYGSVGSSEKYSSRGGRGGDHSNSYKRPRDSYSTREDHRSSSESNRKRIRSDSYQGGGSGGGGSQRYSSSYGGSSTSAQYDDNKRSSSSAVYEDKRQSDRGSYHRGDERHSASRNYAPPPPPPPRISDMAPPSTRYGTTSRGRISHGNTSFRGRISSRGGRGFHRVGTRTSDSLMTRKRTLTSLDYRRKMLGSRSRDYIQRVRMTTTKLRRSGATTRLTRSKKEPGTGSSVKDKDREMAKAINAEFSDDDKDEDVDSNWGEDEKPHEDDDEEVNTEKKVKEVKRKKEKQENIKMEEEEKEEDGKGTEEDDKQEEDDDEAEDGENSKGERAAGSGELPSRRDGKRFIKLNCPHCSHRSVTFKEYSLHLYSGRHNSAMRRIAARHKATLARMRVVQRQEQRRVEVRDASRGTLPSITMFCPICKLNYRSLKAMHHLSESHRQMKRFLTPFCRVCRIQFRSPMLFESHVCSLDHIKRKSLADERLSTRNGEAEGDSSAPEEDDKEVNLDNFMTLDSVGDVDAEEEDEAATSTTPGEKKKKEKPETTESTTMSTTTITTTSTNSMAELEKKPKNKQMIKVGLEYIKRVEVQFCELCKVYLPRNESSERAVALHCSTRSHLKRSELSRYVRDNDDKALRRQAERIHLQTSTTTSSTGSTTVVTGTTATLKAETIQNDGTSGTGVSTSGSTAATVNEVNNGNSTQTNEEKVVVKETSGNATQQSVDGTNKVSKENNVEEEDEEDEFRGDLGDKLWDDVDKDLGDILREAEPGTKSSDDEDSRYDRFRNSEKISQLSKEKDRPEGKDAEAQETSISVSPPKKTEAKVKVEAEK